MIGVVAREQAGSETLFGRHLASRLGNRPVAAPFSEAASGAQSSAADAISNPAPDVGSVFGFWGIRADARWGATTTETAQPVTQLGAQRF